MVGRGQYSLATAPARCPPRSFVSLYGIHRAKAIGHQSPGSVSAALRWLPLGSSSGAGGGLFPGVGVGGEDRGEGESR